MNNFYLGAHLNRLITPHTPSLGQAITRNKAVFHMVCDCKNGTKIYNRNLWIVDTRKDGTCPFCGHQTKSFKCTKKMV